MEIVIKVFFSIYFYSIQTDRQTDRQADRQTEHHFLTDPHTQQVGIINIHLHTVQINIQLRLKRTEKITTFVIIV